MSLYRSAFYWFILLLVVEVVGFWRTYFSQLFSDNLHITHHFHAVSMLLWVLLLTTQSWLIRNRRNIQHRALGKLSFGLAPAVVISGVWVNFHSLSNAGDEFSPGFLSVFWFGFFLPALFAVLYVQAIRHRRNVQLHARYMVSTALVFIQPGLSRAVFNYIAPTGVWVPSFFQMTWLALFIGMWLMFRDWRNGKTYGPFLLSNAAWTFHIVTWVLAPSWSWWQAFAAWAAGEAG